MPHRRSHSVALRLSFLCALTALLFHGLEGALGFKNATLTPAPQNGRWPDKILTWGHPVIETGIDVSPKLTFLYRQEPYTLKKPRRQFRVLVLGDSFTWGVGIAQEDRYTNRLERQLREHFPHQDIRVLNFGARGADTVKEKETFEVIKDQISPDFLLIGFYLNDPKQRGMEYSPEKEKFDNKYGWLVERAAIGLKKAGLPRLSSKWINAVHTFLIKTNRVPSSRELMDRAYDPTGREWQEFLEALKELKVLAKQFRLPTPLFAVLNHRSDKLSQERNTQAEEAAKKMGFRTLNFEEALEKMKPPFPRSAPWGGHASSELNAVYAEHMFPILKKEVQQWQKRKSQ